MKKIVALAIAGFAIQAHAATIDSGRIDFAKGSILLEVSYGGGCERHDFSLDLSACREISPVDCDAVLVEDTHGDICEMGMRETLEFSLHSLGLDKPYYSNGTLTIKGDSGSEVTVRLP